MNAADWILSPNGYVDLLIACSNLTREQAVNKMRAVYKEQWGVYPEDHKPTIDCLFFSNKTTVLDFN